MTRAKECGVVRKTWGRETGVSETDGRWITT